MPKSALPEDGCIIVTGRSGSGKTVCIQNLMRHYRKKMDMVAILCGSKDTCKEYRKYVPGAFVHYISKFGKAERALLQSWYEKMEQLRENDQPNARMMIIFDDLAFMKNSVNKDETVTKMLYNGRHAGILFIWAQQYCLNAGPDLRDQNKLVFATYDKVPENQERIFTAFNPCFKNNAAGFRDFLAVYEMCTEDYGLMVLDNQQSRSKKIEDNVYYFNPKFPVPKFKMLRGSLAWDYDKEKQKQGEKYNKAVTPVNTSHGLMVTKLEPKKTKKRKFDSDSDDDDQRPSKRSRRHSDKKSNKKSKSKSKSWPEYVTIQ